MTQAAIDPPVEAPETPDKFSTPRLTGEERAFAKRLATEIEIITGDPEALSLAVHLMVGHCMRLGDPQTVARLLIAEAETSSGEEEAKR